MEYSVRLALPHLITAHQTTRVHHTTYHSTAQHDEPDTDESSDSLAPIRILSMHSCNLVPRVLSLPRESTLVAAGHVLMYTNQIRTGGGYLT